MVAANNAGESAAYGQSLVDLATTVAEATKEGGFLGIGGTRISEAEQVAIDQVKAVAQPGPDRQCRDRGSADLQIRSAKDPQQ